MKKQSLQAAVRREPSSGPELKSRKAGFLGLLGRNPAQEPLKRQKCLITTEMF